ncbi:MAG TPA: A/G-specific adenine glycosylase, partial [Legionellaceae bacterium]|nr:A/G-specific adenine glycosylase [Legionellaceae bacterium]
MNRIIKNFTGSLLNWYMDHGRKDLPWQTPYHPYSVWVSEIMLQQTQVKTVIPYFLRFMARFPDIHTLAAAPLEEVFALWSGLGYYSRARHLHQCAQLIVTQLQGVFPKEVTTLKNLPGIGPSTAAAIASLAFDQPTAILDGNVKRVLSRYFLVKGQGISLEKTLWPLAQACMPNQQCREYTQAIMDMGATCCTLKNPQCNICPLNSQCQAFQKQMVGQYPESKPKKIRATHHEQFVVLHDADHHIYLEQRPLKGIWGGLWCLPSIEKEACMSTFLQQGHGIYAAEITPLMTFNHSFTHFHLNIHAYQVFVPHPCSSLGTW